MNGFDKSHWTPLMLLAWVRTGNVELVNKIAQRWDDPGSHIEGTHRPLFETRWTSPNGPHQPAVIEYSNFRDHPDEICGVVASDRPDHMTLDSYINYPEEPIAARHSHKKADSIIIEALRLEEISMLGIDAAGGDHQALTAEAWLDLRINYGDQTAEGSKTPAVRWKYLLCPKANVLAHWLEDGTAQKISAAGIPPPHKTAEEAGKNEPSPALLKYKRRPTDQAVLEWYTDRHKNWPEGTQPSRENDETDYKANFKQKYSSRERLRKLRARIAPEWREPGSRK